MAKRKHHKRKARHKAKGKTHCKICKKSHKSPAWCRLKRIRGRKK